MSFRGRVAGTEARQGRLAAEGFELLLELARDDVLGTSMETFLVAGPASSILI